MTAHNTSRRVVITVDDELLAARCARGRVVVIDDDEDVLSALSALIALEGFAVEAYPSATAYLQVVALNLPAFSGPYCVLCDVMMPQMDGLALQRHLANHADMPVVLMSCASGAREAAEAFRGGAVDFLIKPFDADTLLATLSKALALSRYRQANQQLQADLQSRREALTDREQEVARRVAAGHTNPAIARELGIALRTVKLYRQRAVEKLGADTLPDLVRISDKGGL